MQGSGQKSGADSGRECVWREAGFEAYCTNLTVYVVSLINDIASKVLLYKES